MSRGNLIMAANLKNTLPKKLFLAMLLSLSLFSCQDVKTLSRESPVAAGTEAIFQPTPTPQGVIEVKVWVDNPHPKRGETVMLYGSLIKHGVNLGAITMNAYWPDKEQPDQLPDCKVQVIYYGGVCKVNTESFPTGVPTTLRVEFPYQGEVYTGSIDITVR